MIWLIIGLVITCFGLGYYLGGQRQEKIGTIQLAAAIGDLAASKNALEATNKTMAQKLADTEYKLAETEKDLRAAQRQQDGNKGDDKSGGKSEDDATH